MHMSMRHRKGHWTQRWSSAEGLVLRAWQRGRSSVSKRWSLTRNEVSQGVDTQQEDKSSRAQDTGENTTIQKDKALPPEMDQGKSESPKRALIQNGGLSARTAGSESSRKTAGFPSGILVGEREGKNGQAPPSSSVQRAAPTHLISLIKLLIPTHHSNTSKDLTRKLTKFSNCPSSQNKYLKRNS